jgi:hypothetical protein
MTWLITFAAIFMVLDACGQPATQSNLSGFTRGHQVALELRLQCREDGGADVGHG